MRSFPAHRLATHRNAYQLSETGLTTAIVPQRADRCRNAASTDGVKQPVIHNPPNSAVFQKRHQTTDKCRLGAHRKNLMTQKKSGSEIF
jgi:hypothetical protein